MLAGNAAVMWEACLVATADLFPGAEGAALQLSEGMRPAFRRLVGVATADLFLGARGCGIAREESRAAQE